MKEYRREQYQNFSEDEKQKLARVQKRILRNAEK